MTEPTVLDDVVMDTEPIIEKNHGLPEKKQHLFYFMMSGIPGKMTKTMKSILEGYLTAKWKLKQKVSYCILCIYVYYMFLG